uniref:Uncharacterized protein n=1 Tax=Timema genevievae TaxID=629358 RepID=A0A7R9K7Z3_TIMGE|nr:unnamed protein product [Timema genevievae]
MELGLLFTELLNLSHHGSVPSRTCLTTVLYPVEPGTSPRLTPLSCVPEANLTICESSHSCCTREMEDNLRQLVRRDFQNLLHHNSRTLEGLLVSTASRLQGLLEGSPEKFLELDF